jgi:hypothetical protein
MKFLVPVDSDTCDGQTEAQLQTQHIGAPNAAHSANRAVTRSSSDHNNVLKPGTVVYASTDGNSDNCGSVARDGSGHLNFPEPGKVVYASAGDSTVGDRSGAGHTGKSISKQQGVVEPGTVVYEATGDPKSGGGDVLTSRYANLPVDIYAVPTRKTASSEPFADLYSVPTKNSVKQALPSSTPTPGLSEIYADPAHEPALEHADSLPTQIGNMDSTSQAAAIQLVGQDERKPLDQQQQLQYTAPRAMATNTGDHIDDTGNTYVPYLAQRARGCGRPAAPPIDSEFPVKFKTNSVCCVAARVSNKSCDSKWVCLVGVF